MAGKNASHPATGQDAKEIKMNGAGNLEIYVVIGCVAPKSSDVLILDLVNSGHGVSLNRNTLILKNPDWRTSELCRDDDLQKAMDDIRAVLKKLNTKGLDSFGPRVSANTLKMS
jgi:hypothetical protein